MKTRSFLSFVALCAVLGAVSPGMGEDTPETLTAALAASQGPTTPRIGPTFGEVSRERLLASSGWNQDARLVLAQALWGEAGIRVEYARTEGRGRRRGRVVACDHESAATDCMPNRDYAAITWALAKWWNVLQNRSRSFRFGTLVRAYSSAVKPRLMTSEREALARRRGDERELRQIRRRRFLTSLNWSGSNLVQLRRQFGRRGPLDMDREGWAAITATVEAFEAGALVDPCPGALHWDHIGAAVSSGMVRVQCDGDTLNAFYGNPNVGPAQVVEPDPGS